MAAGLLEADGDEGESGRADGQVDVEDPAPGKRVGDDAAEEGSGHAAGGEDGAEEALVFAAFARDDEVADGGLREGDESARAESLQRAKEDELEHGGGDAAEDRAEEEDGDGDIVEGLAAVDVAELAVERRADGGGDHEGGDHPGEMGEAAEIADDAGQGGGDDVLVEGSQRQGEHEAGEDHVEFALADGGLRVGEDGHGRFTLQ
jgi:hypothetical protein